MQDMIEGRRRWYPIARWMDGMKERTQFGLPELHKAVFDRTELRRMFRRRMVVEFTSGKAVLMKRWSKIVLHLDNCILPMCKSK